MNLINGYCLFLVFVDEDKYLAPFFFNFLIFLYSFLFFILVRYSHLPVVNDEPLPHPSLFHPPKSRNLDPILPSRLSLLRTFYIERYDFIFSPVPPFSPPFSLQLIIIMQM